MSATSEHETIHARLGAYFDGELEADDERAVLEHVADCEACQAALDDLMGLHVALGRKAAATIAEPAPTSKAPDPVLPRREAPVVPIQSRRSRRGLVMMGATLAVAAAAAVVVWAPWRGPATEPRLALADTRPVEVRFSAAAFAEHRPYRVERGSANVTPIPLATLSALEKRRDQAALVAALAWSGDRARASSILKGLPTEPAALVDRAALALLASEPEAALEAADQALHLAPALAAARWNRGLALRDLGLPMAAAVELEALAATGEPGWSVEAAERAAALRGPVETLQRTRTAAAARRLAAIAGSAPPLTAADVELTPTPARHYFFDALRVAGSVADLDQLAPLAAALDRQSGGDECARELARVRRLDLARRGQLAPRYRAIAAGTATTEDVDRLLVELATAGPAFDDIRLGAILLSGRLRTLLPDVEAIVATMDNPWYVLLAVQERAIAGRPLPGDAELAHRFCDNPAWAQRCAVIADTVGAEQGALGRWAADEQARRRQLALLAVGSTGSEEPRAYLALAEVLRARGRLALAAATADEAIARLSAESDCRLRTFARIGNADLARRRGFLEHSRALLREADACRDAIDPFAMAVAVDLARDGGQVEDRALAERWIEVVRAAGGAAPYVEAALARLHVGDDAERARATLARLAAAAPVDDISRISADWAVRALIADDGARGAWAAVIEHTRLALRQDGPERCVIVLAADDALKTAAWRDAAGATGGVQWRDPAPWPPLPATALAGCSTTAVVALSPLHGRPPPWRLGAWAWNTGRAAVPSSARAPERLVVAATSPPHEQLDLPDLSPVPIPAGARALIGDEATPGRVAAALATATYVELHAHGLVDLDVDDGGFVALSADRDGDWRLTASDVRKLTLAGAPVVVLAACRVAETIPDLLQRWSLPDAFLAAGARAVIAADVEVPDDLIRAFVDDVRGRLERGEAPAVAAAAARAALVAREPASASWVERLMVFE